MTRRDMTARERALQMRADGKSIRDIADWLKIPKTTIQDWVQTSESRSFDEIMEVSAKRQQDAVRMRGEGESYQTIADELGISKTQVMRLLQRAGAIGDGS